MNRALHVGQVFEAISGPNAKKGKEERKEGVKRDGAADWSALRRCVTSPRTVGTKEKTSDWSDCFFT